MSASGRCPPCRLTSVTKVSILIGSDEATGLEQLSWGEILRATFGEGLGRKGHVVSSGMSDVSGHSADRSTCDAGEQQGLR